MLTSLEDRSPRARRVLRAAALAMTGVVGGGCSPAVPETLHYSFDLAAAPGATAPDGRNALEEIAGYEGWTLEAAGAPLGVLARDGRMPRLVIELDRPSSDRPSRFMRALTLRGPSVCGETVQSIPDALGVGPDMDSDEYVAETMARSGRIAISVRLTSVSSGARTVRIDWGSVTSGTLHIGQRAVTPGPTEVVISTLDCDGPVSVRMDDRVVGELDPGAEAPFISIDPALCHRFARQTYSRMRGGSRHEEVIAGATVVALPEAIDHWMEPAPATIQTTDTSTEAVASRTELVRIPCPTPDALEAAGAVEEEDRTAGDRAAGVRERAREELLRRARRTRSAGSSGGPPVPTIPGI